MGIFEITEHTQATKLQGKDQQLTPSPTEAKDAQAFFDEIAKKEKANSNLPNLTFKTVAQGSTYVLKEFSKDPNSHTTTTKEIGQFQEYTNGYKSTKQLEASISGPNGSKISRETEEISTQTSKSTKVFEAPADKGPQVLKETSERFSVLKDGKEVSSVNTTFGYSDKSGKTNAETMIANNEDHTTRTQVFGGEDLKLKSDVLTGADGKEVQRSSMEDILNDKKEVVGRRETIVQHNKGNTTTTTFEGAADNQLKATQQVIAYDNGKTETYKANAKGDLVLVKGS
jgi:hypothetical protein